MNSRQKIMIQLGQGFSVFRSGLAWRWAVAFLFTIEFALPATTAQPVRTWQASPAKLYVLRGANRRLLDRAEQFLADEQWGDALATLMRLLDADDSAVVKQSENLYVSLPQYCHWLIARLPAKTLYHYRQLVDATSKSWYEQGVANRDGKLLQRVIDKNFCSSWGDDALLALGELALERGDYQVARNTWSQLLPSETWLTYPDGEITLETTKARLVLVAIREGNWQLAKQELSDFQASFSEATGRLGGRQVKLANSLKRLLEQAHRWPKVSRLSDRSTFASNALGRKYQLHWSHPIDNRRLAISPIVVNDHLIFQDGLSVHALRLVDGKTVFAATGKVFQSPTLTAPQLGHQQHALTVSEHYVFGVTTTPVGLRQKQNANRTSVCWGLNLNRDGALAFQIKSKDPKVAFVGAPTVKSSRLYLPIYSNGQMARAGIACYDLSTEERLWQRWVCRANTPASGWTSEIASNLLAYDSSTLYINTNLGAIAAVRADDGRIIWLHTYQRRYARLNNDSSDNYYRSVPKCVYHLGTILAMPTDSNVLLALDARTGQEKWQCNIPSAEKRLIRVAENKVILSDNGLERLDIHTGEIQNSPSESERDNLPIKISTDAKVHAFGDYLIVTNSDKIEVYQNQSESTASSTPREQ